MNLGNNESIVLSLVKHNPNITEKSLQILFLYVTGKKARIDTILHSLQIKGLIDKQNTVKKEMIDGLNLPKNKIDIEILKNLEDMEQLRFGRSANEILFLLSVTEKASLQFLSVFFRKPAANIYAVLQRLEEKGCTTSYHSRIMRKDVVGRKYYPKYYTLTNLGKQWVKVNGNLIPNKNKIKDMLKAPEKQLEEFVL